MNYRQGYSFFERQELLENTRQIHKELFGKRPEADVYNALDIRSLEKIICELKVMLIKKIYI